MLKVIGQMDHVVHGYDDMTLRQKVDVGARVRKLLNLVKALDESISDDIKLRLKNRDGAINGETFKAVLAYHEDKRCDIKALKELFPDAYQGALKSTQVGRITYEAK